MKAQWTPRGTLFPGTHQLEHLPTTPPQTKGIDPPPSQDCSDVSLTYPDWTIHDLIYNEPASWSEPAATASFNMSVTHRPTGVTMRCQWGAEAGVTETWSGVSEYVMLTVCAMEGPDPLNSNSSLLARFDATLKELTLESRWRCGDTAGTYSTEFISQAAYPTREDAIGLGLNCASRTCTLDTPFRIEGRLLAPVAYLTPKKYPAPEGVSSPGCLRKSQAIDSWDSPFILTRFLWQATTVNQVMHYGQYSSYPGSTQPYNRTLVVGLENSATNTSSSCAFNDAALDGETATWWPCFAQDPHRRPLQRTPETWVQFSAGTGQLRVNQTWYCNSENGATAYKIVGTATISKTTRTGYYGQGGLTCGNGTNAAYGVPCPPQIFITGKSCDYTYAARWCTLGDRDGFGPAGPPVTMSIQSIDVAPLPPGDLTEPDPSSSFSNKGGDKESAWSCTVASLGRGPVRWTLQTTDFFSLTDWFGYIGRLSENMGTQFAFDLNSTVFSEFPPTAASRDGVIRDVGVSNGPSPFLTPGMRAFDPARVYTNTPLSDYWAPGWKFYNGLGWQVRLDISAGYMELNHSWYCDDKNLDTPVVFNGTWNGVVELECKWEFPGPRTGELERQGVVCGFAGGKKEIVVTPTVTSYVSDKRIPDLIRQY